MLGQLGFAIDFYTFAYGMYQIMEHTHLEIATCLTVKKHFTFVIIRHFYSWLDHVGVPNKKNNQNSSVKSTPT